MSKIIPHKSEIIKPHEVIDNMTNSLLNGHIKGTTTYIDQIDKAWTWRNGEVTLWSGYANEGKSSFLRFLTLIKCLEENKKACFYAPEDSPAEYFFDDIIHTFSGKSTDKDKPVYEFIGPDLYQYCYELIKDKFIFLKMKTPYNTIENIVKEWRNILKEDVYMFVIDPYVRMTRSSAAPERDDLYAGYLMGYLNDFAQEYLNVSLHMVMHQVTPKRENGKNNNYPAPNMYAIKGGGTYSDVTDNVISIWRPKYATDKRDTWVKFISEKIKKQKFVGTPQELDFFFDRKKNRFVGEENKALYNFEKWLK